jgi:hypothetical protein
LSTFFSAGSYIAEPKTGQAFKCSMKFAGLSKWFGYAVVQALYLCAVDAPYCAGNSPLDRGPD